MLPAVLTAVAAVVGLVASGSDVPANAAPLKGDGEGLELVANVDYEGGTDMELRTIKGRVRSPSSCDKAPL